ncbi:hypothetical protein OROMI_024291 [Orobanche minor]
MTISQYLFRNKMDGTPHPNPTPRRILIRPHHQRQGLRLRVAEQNGLLVEIFGPIPELSIQHNINQSGDAADIQDVFKLLKEDGVFDEIKVPFSSTNVAYGKG